MIRDAKLPPSWLLALIGQLYDVERQAKEEGLDTTGRLSLGFVWQLCERLGLQALLFLCSTFSAVSSQTPAARPQQRIIY
jgi:hypothetical protein